MFFNEIYKYSVVFLYLFTSKYYFNEFSRESYSCKSLNLCLYIFRFMPELFC